MHLINKTSRGNFSGFTLVEMAIVLVIIGLLLGGLLMPFSAQMDQQRISETKKSLENAKEALLGFAITTGFLPCPDTTGDGVAEAVTAPPSGPCPGYEGNLPWVTLGVAELDAWGNRFRYRLSNEFQNARISPCANPDGRLGLCDPGVITILTRDVSTKAAPSLAITVVAVIVSHGKNGYSATTSTGGTRPVPPPINVDERNNRNGDNTFMSRLSAGVLPPGSCSDTAAGQPICEFDDLLVWIPTNILFSRMVGAGRLP